MQFLSSPKVQKLESNKITSFQIPVYENQTLALHRMGQDDGIPILLIHGSVENGKIFYTDKGKGFAWFLGKNGYDVYVADLSGKGESKPPANKSSKQTQTKVIVTELTLFFEKIEEIRGKGCEIQIGAHSWGGVLLLAYMARFPQKFNITGGVFFGTKRRISILTLEKLFKINLMWNWVGRIFTWKEGFLNAQKIGLGSDNEPKFVYLQTNEWVFSKKWIDPGDGFDYHQAFAHTEIPPIMFLTGEKDKLLGHPKDVQNLIRESKLKNFEFKVIGKKTGHLHDYDHINLLTHKDAVVDHFPLALDFLKKCSKQ